MPEITLQHKGAKLPSEAIKYAIFWEKGAGTSVVGIEGDHIKVPMEDDTLQIVPIDTLSITMKDSNVKYDPIKGGNARPDANTLEASRVLVHWIFKATTTKTTKP
jgi:hypothetical protein